MTSLLAEFKRMRTPLLFGLTFFSCCLFIAPLASLGADNQLTSDEKKAGWLLLFDGQTLDGWMTSDGKASRKPVEDNCINPHGSGHYMLVHTQQWSNFVLSLDFKI